MASTSVHVLSFDHDLGWEQLRAQRPAAATYWHPGCSSWPDASGVPLPDLRAWTVLACWEDAAQWSRAVEGPGPWQGAAEHWSALLAPGPTRDVPAPSRWAHGRDEPPFGPPTTGPLRGSVAVLTTVGLSGEHLGDVLRFARDVERVVGTLATAPGSLGFRLAAAEHFPSQVDAFTFSLWTGAQAARSWAYSQGVHATAVQEHLDGPHITRGTFTTFAVLQTLGRWSHRHVVGADRVTA